MRALWIALLAACGGGKPVDKHAAPVVAAKPVDAGVPTPTAPRMPMFGVDDCANVHGPDSAKLFEKACTAGTGQGCEDLAIQYRCGVGVPADPKKALEYLVKACTLGDGHGCGRVAKTYMDTGDPAQGASAMKYAQLGCTAKDPESCGYVGVFYWQGIGVPADPVHAAQLFDEQCLAHNMMSCANLAVELYMGNGIPRDVVRAKPIAEQACKADMQAACNILGGILVDEGGEANFGEALGIFARLCETGAAVSCDNLGQLEMLGRGSYAVDRDKARAAFKKACDLGNGTGCTHLGEM